MTTLQLSEHLYPVDEVVATFTQCLLMRSSIHECLYWLWELIYTCGNIGDILIDMYQSFYSVSPDTVGLYLKRKINTYYTTLDRRHLADVVCNMRLLTPCPTAYYITQHYFNSASPTCIYKRKSWMADSPIYMTGLLGSIYSKHLHNIGYYLKRAVTQHGYEETYSTVLRISQTKEVRGQNIRDVSALISRCIHPIAPTKTCFIRSNTSVVEKIERHFNTPSIQYYHKLKERRLYSTHLCVPPGEYGRFHVEGGLEEACNMHWQYYCFASLEWNKKFTRFEGCLDPINRCIQWKNDDDLDDFCDDDNCMDFDEQSKSVKEMSLHHIEVIADPYKWFQCVVAETLNRGIAELSL